jgi:two-component system sensor histidine kinase BaeS
VDLVVVLTRQAPNTLTSAGPWFALSSLLILMVAALVSWRLGRRFVRPLAAAQDVTLRVAAGDLDARVPVPASAAGPELIALARSINDMADRLARAKGAERLFLQSVSHDLRTPLTSIRGFAEAIQDGAAPDVQGAAGVIASEARRLERLVADLLALATLEARRFTLQLQAVDLNSSARSTAAAFAPAAAELGLSLTVTGGGGGPVDAIADPDRLAQVTANLVENALRYSRHGVTVETVAGGGRARLCVEDDGPGITAADLPHVFDRLYESRPRPDRPIGSGLGLTIVSELVRAMGGSVWAESPTGAAGGTRMVVELATPPIHVPA